MATPSYEEHALRVASQIADAFTRQYRGYVDHILDAWGAGDRNAWTYAHFKQDLEHALETSWGDDQETYNECLLTLRYLDGLGEDGFNAFMTEYADQQATD